MATLDASLTTPVTPDPVNDPGNWREIDRLKRLAAAEGREFDPADPYNWKGIQVASGPTTPSSPGGVAGVTAPTATPTTAEDVAARNRQVFSTTAAILTNAGLGDAFTLGADGTPGGWLWEQITSGIDDATTLQLAFEQTPQFQARYPVIAQIRAAGGNPPAPKEVRAYEDTIGQVMRQAGLPAEFYDTPQERQALMGTYLSPVEVEQRLGAAWEQVRNTDPAVRQAFTEFYGINGDAQMAAFFLDPTNVQAKLDKTARSAYTAGMGKTMGLNVDKAIAERIAELPKTDAGIVQDLQSAASIQGSGLLTEGIAETTDLNDATAIGSVALGDGTATAALERRVLERQANSRATVGGAASTQQGLTGLRNS